MDLLNFEFEKDKLVNCGFNKIDKSNKKKIRKKEREDGTKE